jgi:ATP-dependent Clp protease ATP-binding subunit ClpA
MLYARQLARILWDFAYLCWANPINEQGHSIQPGAGLVEYVQREGYSEKYGVRPMRKMAMRILRDVVSLEMLKNGGRAVRGVVEYDRRSNKCCFKEK